MKIPRFPEMRYPFRAAPHNESRGALRKPLLLHAAVLPGGMCMFSDFFRDLRTEFAGYNADKLLKDIFHGDDAECAAVFIRNNGHISFFLLQQL